MLSSTMLQSGQYMSLGKPLDLVITVFGQASLYFMRSD